MAETKNPTAGRVVWHDLMTTDPKAARAFYSELFGWNFKDVDMGGSNYGLILAGEQDIGGVVALEASHGAPSHWIPYITVDSVDAAVSATPGLGGTVRVPAMDIPKVGRFAVVEDPTGAVFSPFKGTMDAPERVGPPPVGHFCWDEVLTSEPEVAATFYTALTGWTVKAQDMGPMGTYRVCHRGDTMAGGIGPKPPMMPRSAWMAYVAVANLEESTARVTSLKGTVVVQPMTIPDIGRMSVFIDPTGAALALFSR